MQHYMAVRRIILCRLDASRAIQMPVMKRNMDLLKQAGHGCTLRIIFGAKIKKKRVRAPKFTFQHCRTGKMVLASAFFDEMLVDVTDIDDRARFNEEFLFISSVAIHCCKTG